MAAFRMSTKIFIWIPLLAVLTTPLRRFLMGLLFLGLAATLPAQWLKIKTPGIPRQPDGKPALNAPLPRAPDGKPDLSGLWGTEDNTYGLNLTADLKPGEVLPWADEVYRKRLDALDKDTPATRCLPGGPTNILGAQYRIIQAPNVTAILYGDGAYRQIFTDGRDLPRDPNPTWWGYSVGHWEGDTLVVQSAGFNDRSWLDYVGHPHTEDLRVTERFTRIDFGHMQLQFTLDDPRTFTKPVNVSLAVNYVPDTEMLEYVCNENEKDYAHLVGKVSDEVKGDVKVASRVLSRYAGNYQMDEGGKMKATVTVSGDQLMFSIGGKGAVPLTTLSETSFFFPGGFPLDFVLDTKETVTSLLVHAPCGDFKFVRTETAGFDAASVKPRLPGPGVMNRESPGRVDYVGVPLMVVIARAYDVDGVQVAAPDWVSSEGYEIRATFPPDTPPEQFRLMLQKLLADRFHLAVHHERRELSAYVLTVAKGGLRMKAHPDARMSYNTPTDRTGRHIIGTITMPILAKNLSYIVVAPVIDQTAVEGIYDISLDWVPPNAAGDAPSIYTALQDQLGLRLESKKAPFDVIVVDRIDKNPTEN